MRRTVCVMIKNFHYINIQLSVGGVPSPGGSPSMLIGPYCIKYGYHVIVAMVVTMVSASSEGG